MKKINIERVVYSNGEKVVYFTELLAKAMARVEFLQAKLEGLSQLDPDEHQDQDWSSDVKRQIDAAKKRA